jgi:heme A synthase
MGRRIVVMSDRENGVSWFHRLGTLVAVMAFFLYTTGTIASGAVQAPARSTSKSGQAFTILVVTLIALSVLFVWLLWKSNSRRYLKNLGIIALAVLVALVLVELSAAPNLHPATATVAYTFGIQTFFCLTVCLALFTRTDWRWDEPKAPDLASPSIRQVLIFSTAAVFVEPFLGGAFREQSIGIAPHLVLGIAATAGSLWVMEMALTKFSHVRAFKISAVFLAAVLGLQLFFGIISYSMELNARASAEPQPGIAVMNATHAAVGALVLATSLFVTCQGFKYFAPAMAEVSSAILNDHQQPEPRDG